jgi:hypothetical protein
MPQYKPSKLWTEEELFVPDYGTIKKTEIMELGGFLESWLRANGYLEVIAPELLTTGMLTPTDPDPKKTEEEPDFPTPESMGTGAPATEPAMEVGAVRPIEDKVLEFLNSAEVTELTSIRGVAQSTAELILAGRPLEKQRIAEILNDRQRDVITKHVESQEQK